MMPYPRHWIPKPKAASRPYMTYHYDTTKPHACTHMYRLSAAPAAPPSQLHCLCPPSQLQCHCSPCGSPSARDARMSDDLEGMRKCQTRPRNGHTKEQKKTTTRPLLDIGIPGHIGQPAGATPTSPNLMIVGGGGTGLGRVFTYFFFCRHA